MSAPVVHPVDTDAWYARAQKRTQENAIDLFELFVYNDENYYDVLALAVSIIEMGTREECQPKWHTKLCHPCSCECCGHGPDLNVLFTCVRRRLNILLYSLQMSSVWSPTVYMLTTLSRKVHFGWRKMKQLKRNVEKHRMYGNLTERSPRTAWTASFHILLLVTEVYPDIFQDWPDIRSGPLWVQWRATIPTVKTLLPIFQMVEDTLVQMERRTLDAELVKINLQDIKSALFAVQEEQDMMSVLASDVLDYLDQVFTLFFADYL